jgi:hypothetical protein
MLMAQMLATASSSFLPTVVYFSAAEFAAIAADATLTLGLAKGLSSEFDWPAMAATERTKLPKHRIIFFIQYVFL